MVTLVEKLFIELINAYNFIFYLFLDTINYGRGKFSHVIYKQQN